MWKGKFVVAWASRSSTAFGGYHDYSMMSKHLSLLVALLATHSACANLSHAERNSSVPSIAENQSPRPLAVAPEARDCRAPKNKRELPNDRFVRKGGRESK